jgi:hypothetical protein
MTGEFGRDPGVAVTAPYMYDDSPLRATEAISKIPVLDVSLLSACPQSDGDTDNDSENSSHQQWGAQHQARNDQWPTLEPRSR